MSYAKEKAAREAARKKRKGKIRINNLEARTTRVVTLEQAAEILEVDKSKITLAYRKKRTINNHEIQFL